jgi:uncharacterized OsmC-like protein
MTNLNDYLVHKRQALAERKARLESGALQATPLAARVSAEGRSGIRRIRIRDFQVVTDSPPDFAGYDLGPSSPELQLGVLGSCLTHSYLIQAALLQVPVETLEVELSGRLDPRSGRPGFEEVPVYPHDLSYIVHIVSSASEADIARLKAEVERFCPILNLLKQPQSIRAEIDHQRPQSATADLTSHDRAA